MPSYELAVIYKNTLQRPQLAQAIKRAASVVLEGGGVVRSLEYLGSRQLPYRMFRHGVRHTEGAFCVMQFDSTTEEMYRIKDHCRRDTDIVRPRILRTEEEIGRPCDREPCEFGEMDENLRKKLKMNIQEFIKKM